MNYEESKIFRIVPKYLIQFGDIISNNGTGHFSHYDDNRYLNDEIVPDVTFCEAGIVALANKGPNTNGSQFFITLDELPSLNDKYTIIGQTVKGFEQLKKLAAMCGNPDGTSKCNVKITHTGIYDYKDYVRDKKLRI